MLYIPNLGKAMKSCAMKMFDYVEFAVKGSFIIGSVARSLSARDLLPQRLADSSSF